MAASAIRPVGLSFNQVIDSVLYRINYLVYKFISKQVVANHKKGESYRPLRIVIGSSFYRYTIQNTYI